MPFALHLPSRKLFDYGPPSGAARLATDARLEDGAWRVVLPLREWVEIPPDLERPVSRAMDSDAETPLDAVLDSILKSSSRTKAKDFARLAEFFQSSTSKFEDDLKVARDRSLSAINDFRQTRFQPALRRGEALEDALRKYVGGVLAPWAIVQRFRARAIPTPGEAPPPEWWRQIGCDPKGMVLVDALLADRGERLAEKWSEAIPILRHFAALEWRMQEHQETEKAVREMTDTVLPLFLGREDRIPAGPSGVDASKPASKPNAPKWLPEKAAENGGSGQKQTFHVGMNYYWLKIDAERFELSPKQSRAIVFLVDNHNKGNDWVRLPDIASAVNASGNSRPALSDFIPTNIQSLLIERRGSNRNLTLRLMRDPIFTADNAQG